MKEENIITKILEKSKKILLIRKAFDFWVLLARTAAFAGIINFSFRIFPEFTKSKEALFGLTFIGICLTFFMIDNIIHRIKNYYNEKEIEKLQKQANYAKAIPNLNSGFASIHDLIRKNNGDFQSSSRDQKYNAFVHLCNKLSKAFKDITGEQCGVCIKVFEKDKNIPLQSMDTKILKIFSLCRDTENPKNRNFTKPIDHYVAWNTDFFQIFETIGSPKGEQFFEDELPLRKDYWNTSFPLYDETLTYRGLTKKMSDDDRITYWPLPYKSTIVVPICPHSGSKATLDDVIGFLCVDSSEMKVFDKENNYNILTGVADGIYYPLFCWMSMGFK